jgi:KRAB domain-containing zinc finger protein
MLNLSVIKKEESDSVDTLKATSDTKLYKKTNDSYKFKQKHSFINTRVFQKKFKRTRQFICHICETNFTSLYHLTIHKRVHARENPFEFNECTTPKGLARHRRLHSAEKPFACDQCELRFSSEIFFKSHQLNAHSVKREFACKMCEKKFNTGSSLKIHSRVHSREKPFKCEKCDKSFSYYIQFFRHSKTHSDSIEHDSKSNDNGKSKKLQGFESKISFVSGEEQLFECTKCDIKFKIWTNYAIHLRLHSFDKPLKCAKCGQTWQNSNELAQHYKIHTT